MPFEIHHHAFGLLTEYIIQNTETGEYFSVLPTHGALLRRLVLRHNGTPVSVLKAPESTQALMADETYASALMFPFPSRVRHGIYTFEGTAYTLPMNESARHHALHGFLYNRPFDVVGQVTTDTEASITLQYDYKGDYAGYPFPFDFRITYLLTANGQFSLSYDVRNTGTGNCPVGFGWHPYFTLGEEPIDNLSMNLPVSKQVILDDNLLPVREELFALTGNIPIGDQKIDAVFTVADSPELGVTTVLHSPQQALSLNVWQETGFNKFNYLVVYTPVSRHSIAIEALTCNVNAFNNEEGLQILSPNESKSGQIKVWLS
ncbi:aldose 1-epimerase [Tellurirhabdus bombi]|uniref:aldose 1-epimerase n=1 Tax=Tellurirhabdus bombi TaxID=2907205 RepID=UPI001F2C0152|nr:aldose 1-epimerase [Tellurirhabdus bombi]